MEHNHNHNHGPGHSHSHEQPASLKNLIFAIVINGGIVIFEMIFGLMIQSMALISDAVQQMLLHKYGINHTTLQILPFSAGEMEHCNHCN
jgi:Co/Zn/Cd efflux system component